MRTIFVRRQTRERLWSVISGMAMVSMVVYMSGLLYLVPAPQTALAAGSGSVWTTTGSCGEPQNVNHYQVGDHVFINAAGFDAEDNPLNWDIDTVPASTPVATGSANVLQDGTLCFDAYTIQPGDEGVYKVTFGGKHDNYSVEGDGGEIVIPTTNITATKIVCTDEADLPNWGDHKDAALNPPAMIDATTAADWIADHESCSLQPGWSFQWAPAGTAKPADNDGELGSPWTTFGPTDGTGTVSTVVPNDGTHVWIREVFQDGYLPFSNNAGWQEDGSDVSAEIYCGWDLWNYDNFDYADTKTEDATRYCVAWNVPEEREIPESTVIAYKVVCEDEADLPNWGDNDPVNPNITSNTANRWVNAHPGCHVVEDWQFQWAISQPNPGNDFYGEAGDPWMTFDAGVPTAIPVTEPGVSTWFREVLQEGYIPFAGDNTDNYTAQFYCNSDVINNDNYDRIYNTSADQTYYCVAWNAPEEQPQSEVIASKVVCDQEAYLPNWGDNDPVNPNITSTTAQDWVDASEGHCWLARDWKFQWAMSVANPGNDLYGEAGDPWMTFDAGVPTAIPVTEPGVSTWFREVLQEGYIPFAGDNTDNYTAQFYCNSDVINNDNYDRIYNTSPDQTYYCVGWNTPVEQPTGKIGGTKFYDWDRNAEVSEGDEPLEGWTIFLDLNDNDQWDPGEPMQQTDQNGFYEFAGLIPGDYDVCELLPIGWVHTPNPAGISYGDVYCRESEVDATVDFFNYRTGAVQGYKWNDVNGDGQWNDEPTLGGWTIFIDLNGNEELDLDEPTDVTDQDGHFWFGDLEPGTYHICEVQQDGWDQTAPQTGDGCHDVELPYYGIGNQSGCYLNEVPFLVSNNALPDFQPTPYCNFGNEVSEYNIRVVKHVVPMHGEESWDPEGWTWSLDAETGIAGQDDRDVATHDSHVITESPTLFPADAYDATWQCWYGEDNSAGSGIGRSFSTTNLAVQPENGDHLVCEFTNTEMPSFALTLTKSVDKTAALPGDTLTYTLTWGVTGNTNVDLDLKDSIPTNTTFVSATNSGVLDGSEVKWGLGVTTPPSGGAVSFTVTINQNTPNGTQITNVASLTGTIEGEVTATTFLDEMREAVVETVLATSASVQTVLSNQVVTTILIPTVLGAETPDLSIVKSTFVSFANRGDVVTYSIVVKNGGDGEATNVIVVDTLPIGFTYEDGSTTRTWAIGTLAAGASTTLTYEATIGDGAAIGVHTNQAVLSADGLDPKIATASIEVRQPEVLGAEVLADTGAGFEQIALFFIGTLILAFGALGLRMTRRLA